MLCQVICDISYILFIFIPQNKLYSGLISYPISGFVAYKHSAAVKGYTSVILTQGIRIFTFEASTIWLVTKPCISASYSFTSYRFTGNIRRTALPFLSVYSTYEKYAEVALSYPPYFFNTASCARSLQRNLPVSFFSKD